MYFYNKMPYTNGMPYKDKERNREYQRKWWGNHKKLQNDRNRTLVRSKKAWIDTLKTGRVCMDCEQVYPPYVMDFDHRDGTTKVFGVSQMIAWNLSRVRILEEIAKCDLVCSNCHRIRTHRRRIVQQKNEILIQS